MMSEFNQSDSLKESQNFKKVEDLRSKSGSNIGIGLYRSKKSSINLPYSESNDFL
jgi:hypothetical protein